MKKKPQTPAKKPTKPSNKDAKIEAGKLLDAVFREFSPNIEESAFRGRKIEYTPTGKTIMAKPRPFQVVVAMVALSRNEKLEKSVANAVARRQTKGLPPDTRPWGDKWKDRWVHKTALRSLLRRNLPLTEKEVLKIVRWTLNDPTGKICNGRYPLVGLHTAISNQIEEHGMTSAMAGACIDLLAALKRNSQEKENPNFIDKFAALLKEWK